MWKWIAAFPLFMHGMAHLSGFVASWAKQDASYTDKPWIFPGGFTLHSAVGKAWGCLWLVTAIGLVSSAFGLLFAREWWPRLTLIASTLSLVAIVPWWCTVPAGAKAGVFFDLIIIAILLSTWGERIIQALK